MNGRHRPVRWFAFAGVVVACVLFMGGPFGDEAGAQKPEGEMRWALYVTIAPSWFDPAEVGGLNTFWIGYALHDALGLPSGLAVGRP